MTVKEVLGQLKSLGDDARSKHNIKSGAPENQFGVKLGDIRAIAKKIKTDHELALKLWDTGNVEAQLLAALIIKPKSLAADELDTMTRSTTCAQVAEWLNAYVVAQHPEKDALREKWMKDKDRWAARAGWHLTAGRVNKDADGLDLPALLDRIEKELPKAKPEVQWTMNNTLAAIGIHDAKLRKRAIAIGEKIGLYKDWPVSKGCTPPYVPVWVEFMVKRKGEGRPQRALIVTGQMLAADGVTVLHDRYSLHVEFNWCPVAPILRPRKIGRAGEGRKERGEEHRQGGRP